MQRLNDVELFIFKPDGTVRKVTTMLWNFNYGSPSR